MCRYTVIGAGPVGTLMALMLARRGAAVQLIERRPDPRHAAPERGRSINLAMAARGIVALEHAGLGGRMASALMPMPGRMLHDEHGTLKFLPYGQQSHEIIYALGREQLDRLMIDAAAEQPTIELRFDTRCLDVDLEDGSVALHDERSGRDYRQPFEVLLGADGAGSAVRTALRQRRQLRSREEFLDHDYKELSMPATAQAPAGYAFDPRALHIWPRGGYMLIALPNPDGTFTATMFLPRQGEPSFEQLRTAAAVQAFFAAEFGDAARAIPDLAQQFLNHPQGRLGTVYCEHWQLEGRVLLLGDAAHAMVPFHGQGLNCGFEDCLLLDRALAALTGPAAPARAALFRRFEAERRPDADAISAMALENYQEMRDTVRTPEFERRQGLAAALERRFPQRFIPRYSMVMFHPEIPYAEAQRRGAAQERVLDVLLADPEAASIETLLERAGL